MVPLLIESGNYRGRCQRILVVDCPEDVQVARIVARDGGTEDAARAILAAQATREQRLAAADDLIVNTGTEADLAPQVAALDVKYRALAAGRSA